MSAERPHFQENLQSQQQPLPSNEFQCDCLVGTGKNPVNTMIEPLTDTGNPEIDAILTGESSDNTSTTV